MDRVASKTVSQNRLRRVNGASAFTLIELLLVMVILAILATVAVKSFVGRAEQAKVTTAKATIESIKGQLNVFEQDNGHFPTTSEGLQALVTKPSGNYPHWTHFYIEKLPMDPWGNPFVYRFVGTPEKDFDLLSAGPDGREGSDDDIK